MDWKGLTVHPAHVSGVVGVLGRKTGGPVEPGRIKKEKIKTKYKIHTKYKNTNIQNTKQNLASAEPASLISATS